MYVAPEVTDLTIDGLGGNDTITVTGSDANDVIDLSPGHGTLTGDGYRLAIAGVESIAADGGGGVDVALPPRQPHWAKTPSPAAPTAAFSPATATKTR